jgi:twitching motility protein PilU
LDRIINFFPEERRNQLLMDISANLRALVSQRLVRTEDGKGRRAAIEILLNTTTIADKIFKGEFHEIKGIMDKSRELGMRTFDWSLFQLYNEGHIAYEEAIRNADSANELRLAIKLKSQRGEPASASAAVAGADLTLHDYRNPAELEEERKKELAAQEEKKRLFETDKIIRLEQEARQLAKAQMEIPPPPVLPQEKLQLEIG